MNARRDPDLLIKAFLEDGVNELPDRSYDAVRAAIEQKRQWVVLGPWRERQMTRFAIFGVAAAAIVLAAVVGLRFLPSDGETAVGSQPAQTATPTVAPTASPRPTAAPSPAPTPPGSVLPPLTEQYTSSMHGMTVSYPAGWMLQPATEPWTSAELGELTQESAFADVIFEKEIDTPFITLASQPLGGKTGEQWTSDFLAIREGCGPTQPHTVDGIEGVITACGDGLLAVVASDELAFVVWLYRIDDMAYFEQILATVRLDPTAAR